MSQAVLESGQSVEEIDYQIARSNLDTFLTPSSIAAELRPDLDPAEAAEIYTGALSIPYYHVPVRIPCTYPSLLLGSRFLGKATSIFVAYKESS